MDKQTIIESYNRRAWRYDLIEKLIGLFGPNRWRRKLFSQATGDILEVAAGTGSNTRYYPPKSSIVLTDLSPAMLAIAKNRVDRLHRKIQTVIADAEQLPFTDRVFDTVCSSLSTCTFTDPLKALKEMKRVIKPGGKILLFEHGRGFPSWIGRWQDRKATAHYQLYGCRLNQVPETVVEKAGLKIKSVERHLFGIFRSIIIG